ncbi:FAD-dependent monooxygenase [Kutzneria sp. NPDC052558]|uniref:FAD-dependent monooxygenase n=1 Tax=Kutzneria sp. NPDC052558 TaxID=3364121 RepID=UPI0037CCBADA
MVDVTIVGAGPVGLWAAAELARRGVEVVAIERLDRPTPYSKALTVHPRTLEVFGQRGIAREAIDAGVKIPNGHFGNLKDRMDFSVLDTPYPFTLLYAQEDTEILLERTARALGADIRRGQEVIAVADKGDVVVTTVRSGDSTYDIESTYLIGADGAHSFVRKTIGVDFEGTSPARWGYLGDVALDNPPDRLPLSVANERGNVLLVPLPKDGLYRFVGNSTTLPEDNKLTLEQLRTAVADITGEDFGIRDPLWLSRYGDAARLVSSYRVGRIFLAGDAAHIHLPAGGVGMNVGIQDAANLAWRIADVIEGLAPDSYLDQYHAERRPVGVDLLVATRGQSVLFNYRDDDVLALRELLSHFIVTVPAFSKALAERLAGFSVKYDLPGHPLAGSRAQDLPLIGTTLFDALHDARPALVALPEIAVDDDEAKAAFAAHGVAAYSLAPQERPEWAGVTAALIRPDGYVAWATETRDSSVRSEIRDAVVTLRPGRVRQ